MEGHGNIQDVLLYAKFGHLSHQKLLTNLSVFKLRRLHIYVSETRVLKVARYSFSRPIPPKFEQKLRRHKQSFEKIAPTVVLDKDENLLSSGLQ